MSLRNIFEGFDHLQSVVIMDHAILGDPINVWEKT